jgi:hypothetical protein
MTTMSHRSIDSFPQNNDMEDKPEIPFSVQAYSFEGAGEEQHNATTFWGRCSRDRKVVGFVQSVPINTNVVRSNPAQAMCIRNSIM